MGFHICPRCGDQGYEKLSSHDYCIGCNYSSEFNQKFDLPIPPWAQQVVDDPKEGIAKLIREADAALEKANQSVAEIQNETTTNGTSADVA